MVERIRQVRELNALYTARLEQIQTEFDHSTLAESGESHVPIHADLHPKNLISNRGKLSSIIDWGDMNLGDPANDLASVWMHFDPAVHMEFWNAYGPVAEGTTARVKGWALLFGVNMLAAEASGEQDFGGAGSRTLQRLLKTS